MKPFVALFALSTFLVGAQAAGGKKNFKSGFLRCNGHFLIQKLFSSFFDVAA